MRRWITRNEQPTLDELLDEPIVRLMMASDGVNRSEVEAVIANLRSMRPGGADQVIFRLSGAPLSQPDGTAQTRRRKHDEPIPAASSLRRLPVHCVAPQPGFLAR
jgi:hypothetical protein